ncbi:DUF4956 domain-containing protein [Patescibacteria group bacterium]
MERFFAEVVNSNINIETIVLSMVIATGIGFAISLVYKTTFKGVSFISSFLPTLVLLPVITSVVILVIGSNLARAFGLVGALSIIRFRTPIKDPKDISFIFVALVEGLAVGSQNYHIAMISTAFVLVLAYVMDALGYGLYSNSNYFLTILIKKSSFNEENISGLLGKSTKTYELSSMNTSFSSEDQLRVTYKLNLKDDKKKEFIKQLEDIQGTKSVTLVAADNYVMH